MTDATEATDATDAPRPIPARRRRLFEGPLFWAGLIIVGIALVGALSFLPARGDVASAQPDVGAYCAQVDVLGSTDLLSLVAGVTAGPALPFVGSPTSTSASPSTTDRSDATTAAFDQLEAFEEQLVSLERVAPHEVRSDVHQVRLAVDGVLTSLRQAGPTNGIAASSLMFTISDAQNDIQRAIGRIAPFTQDTCGLDIRGPSLGPGLFSN